MKTHYLIFAMFFCFSLSGQEKIEKRLALIIGNANYEKGPLKNPVNDALLIANTLEKLDFDVMLDTNVATIREFSDIVRDFGRRREQYDVGFIYYAGHGIQVKSENFLLPTKEIFESIYDVQDNGLSVQKIMRYLTGMSNQVNILILDACRDNPYEPTWQATRSLKGGGLAKIPPPTGSLIAFSTDAGQTAADGDGENSVYSTSLAKNMLLKNTSLDQVFRNVRTEVVTITNMGQRPVESSQLTGEAFYLVISDYKDEFDKIDKLMTDQDYYKALELANYIIAQEPNNLRAITKRGDCYQRLREYEQALFDYDRVLSSNPTDARVLNSKAILYFHNYEFDKAIEYYTQAINIDTSSKKNAIYYYNLSGLYAYSMTNLTKAIECLTNGIQSDSVYYSNYLRRASIYSESSIQEYEKASSDLNIVFPLIEKKDTNALIEFYIASSELAERMNNDDKALTELENALNLTGTQKQKAEVYYELGEFYEWKIKNLQLAIDNYQKSIDADPQWFSGVFKGASERRIAICFSKLNEFSKAEKFCDKSLQKDPLNYMTYYTKSEVLRKKKDYKAAHNLIDKGLELRPDLPMFLDHKGYLYLHQGEWNLALELYKKSLENLIETNSTEKGNIGHAYDQIGWIYKQIGEYDLSNEYYEKSLEVNPTASAFSHKGVSLADEGKFEEAMIMYQEAISIDPDYSGAYQNIASLHLDNGNHKEALSYLNKAIELAPTAQLYLVRGYNTCFLTEDEEIKDITKSILDIKKAIELDSTYSTAYLCLAHVYESNNNHEDVIYAYTIGIKSNPKDIKLYIGRGDYYRRIKQQKFAISNYLLALDITPNDISLFQKIAFSYWSLNSEKSVEYFSKIIELEPLNTDAYFYRGLINTESLGNYQESINDYNKIIEIDSNYFGVFNNRANAYEKAGLFQQAIDDYSQAIYSDEMMTNNLGDDEPSQLFRKYRNRGYIYRKMEKFDEALADYNKSIELNIEYAVGYNSRALLYYYDLKQYKKSLLDFSKAIELDSANRSYYYSRIKNYIQIGEYKNAEEDCNTTINLDRRDPEGYYHMSTILGYQKKYLSAINMLTIAITRLPDRMCENNGYFFINDLEGNSITLSDLYLKRGDLYKEAKAYDEMCLDYKKSCEIIECKESVPISVSEVFNEYCQ